MKKIMIAAAVVGAFAGTAQAQTSVTLYGIADANIRVDRTSNGTFSSIQGGEINPTRWGIRGTEDLGGGLKATFNFEQAITSDTGIAGGLSNGWQRISVVGLQGNFGYIRAGVDYSPFWRAWSGVDVAGGASLVSTFGSKAGANVPGGATRMANGIYYDSPLMNGLSLRGAFQFGETGVAATKNTGNIYSLAALYGNGPIQVNIGHFNAKTTAVVTTKSNTIGATYDFKAAKIHALYNTSKNTGATLNQEAYGLGVTVPLGKFTIRGSVMRLNDKTVTNADAKGFGLGAQYALSQRTIWYANYARIDNNTAAALMLSGGLQAGNVMAGSNPSAFTTGLRHAF